MALPPSSTASSNLLTTQRALIETLCSFLTVATHHLLYLRRIYPPVSFLLARAYNQPVRQNRHPDVCAWINDAIASVREQIEKNTVERIAICIFECSNHEVLEKWTFDLHSFPSVTRAEHDVPFETANETELRRNINVIDLEASFRSVLSRLDTVAGKMRPLPDGPNAPECSFTISIELKDQADAPIGRLSKAERNWIVTEPEREQNTRSNGDPQITLESEGAQANTLPVRRLEAGEFRMEMFVEESAVKAKFPSTHKTTLEKTSELSFGAGSEKFDPENGYELEAPDVNRKPQGGASTDYQRG